MSLQIYQGQQGTVRDGQFGHVVENQGCFLRFQSHTGAKFTVHISEFTPHGASDFERALVEETQRTLKFAHQEPGDGLVIENCGVVAILEPCYKPTARRKAARHGYAHDSDGDIETLAVRAFANSFGASD